MVFTRPPLPDLFDSVNNSQNPIGMRMRAAYYLRQTFQEDENDAILTALCSALADSSQGSLLRHEVAYVLGQIRCSRIAVPSLLQTLDTPNDCVMVRHECAEALGAIGDEAAVETLERLSQDDDKELAQTCQLALDVIHWRASGAPEEDAPAMCACMQSPYDTTDPAPPHPSHANMEWSDLGDILCDVSLPLFERYRAMFSLRNRGGKEAVEQLCRALKLSNDALLRHEVAYVLGQLQHADAFDELARVARQRDEHVMVRHECAEALGALEVRDWDKVEKVLREMGADESEDLAVRESCWVALDAADYWKSNTDNVSFAESKAGFQEERILVNHFNVA